MIAIRVRIADYVNRIAYGGGGGQIFAQFRFGLIGQRRQMQTGSYGGVRGHDAGSARVGYNAQLVSFSYRLRGVKSRVIKEFRYSVYALNAALL